MRRSYNRDRVLGVKRQGLLSVRALVFRRWLKGIVVGKSYEQVTEYRMGGIMEYVPL